MISKHATQTLERLVETGTSVFASLAQPRRLSRLQQALLVLLMIWVAYSLSRAVWAIWPVPEARSPEGAVINPAVQPATDRRRPEVALEPMLGLGLFGAGQEASGVAAPDQLEPSSPRAGIENGARETRLDLKLTGILASSASGLGQAVIESDDDQVTYSVGDGLPGSGSVTLAKVMADRIVIDNNGTYELLRLFEDTGLVSLLTPTTATRNGAAGPEVGSGTITALQPSVSRASALARRYRDQLYDDPQSLDAIVQISAVRGADGLRGYRVSPGQNAAQFTALGFRAGDVVTAVNGLPLSDPTNTMRLYQLMRNATEATFDIERDGSTIALSVKLEDK